MWANQWRIIKFSSCGINCTFWRLLWGWRTFRWWTIINLNTTTRRTNQRSLKPKWWWETYNIDEILGSLQDRMILLTMIYYYTLKRWCVTIEWGKNKRIPLSTKVCVFVKHRFTQFIDELFNISGSRIYLFICQIFFLINSTKWKTSKMNTT